MLLFTDIDECSNRRTYVLPDCHSRCGNTEGGYTCECRSGFSFTKPGTDCVGKPTNGYNYHKLFFYMSCATQCKTGTIGHVFHSQNFETYAVKILSTI